VGATGTKVGRQAGRCVVTQWSGVLEKLVTHDFASVIFNKGVVNYEISFLRKD
jgi:hypothetical protein